MHSGRAVAQPAQPDPPKYVEEILLLNRAIDACFGVLRISEHPDNIKDSRTLIAQFSQARDRALVGIEPTFYVLRLAREYCINVP